MTNREPISRGRPTTPRNGRESFWLPWAAAVLLFVVSLALTWQVARLTKTQTTLRAELERTAEPRPNVSLVYLGGQAEAEEAAVSWSEDFFVLVVTPEAAEAFEEYRVEVTDGSGRVLEEVRGLERSDRGTLRLGLSDLAEGEYRVTVWGLDPDGRGEAKVGVYPLRVG